MKKKIGIFGILVVTALMLSAIPTVSANEPPVADADPDYQEAYVGETVYFNSWNSYDPDGYIISWYWMFRDGGYDRKNYTSHVYYNSGYYNVTLIVNDGVLNSTPNMTTVTIFGPPNTPPVADAGGPYPGLVSDPIQFNGSNSYDPDGDPITYAWDFGDGSNGSGVSPTHIYAAAGTYTLIPMIVFTLIARKYLVRGMTFGLVKG